MFSRNHFLFLTFLAVLALAFTPVQAAALTVKDIRIGLHPDKTRMVLELSDMAKFRVTVQPDPWRLMIDMPSFDWQVGRISNPKSSAISVIRQGALQSGISRVAIDLKGPVVVKDAFLLRASEGKPDRLVIDFNPSSAAAAASGKSFGLLETDDAGSGRHSDDISAAAPSAPPIPAPPPQSSYRQAAATGGGLVIPPRKPAGESTLPPPAAQQKQQAQHTQHRADKKPVIVIDPGHGGVDPGTIGANGTFEKHVSLAMARQLAAALRRTGRYNVVLTRDSDTYLRLSQRVAFARAHNADLFISLHADSIGKSNVRGASIYTLSEKASDEQTARLAERENKADIIAGADLSHEDEDVANILISLAMRDTMNQSAFFANTAIGNMQSRINVLDKTPRHAGFAVLKAADIPSVLIELGFMSNKIEAQLLSSDDYRAKIAESLVSSIDAYFETVSRNNRS